jgi:WD40 repeat protein
VKLASTWFLVHRVALFLVLSFTSVSSQDEKPTRPDLLLRNSYLGMVGSLAFSPDGRFIATAASEEGWVAIWDARTGFRLRVIQAYTENSTSKYSQSVLRVIFNPSGQLLATSGATFDGKASVRLWETQSGRLVRELKYARGNIAFSRDGKTLITEFERGKDYKGPLLKLWDVDNGRPLLAIPGDEHSVGPLTFDPTGSLLIAAIDKKIVWFELSTGQRLRTLDKTDVYTERLVFDTAGDLIGVFTGDDGDNYKKVLLLNVSRDVVLFKCRIKASYLLDVAISPDMSLLAIARSLDMSIILWNVRTGELVHTMKGHTAGPFLYTVDFSPDGRTLASGSGDDESRGEVKLWEVESGKSRLTLGTPGYRVKPIFFSNDGRFLAFSNGQIWIWNTRIGTPLHALAQQEGGEITAAFNRDASLIVSGRTDGLIMVREVLTGKVIKRWEAHPQGVTTVRFSHNGRWLVSGGEDKTIKIWDPTTWKQIGNLPPQSGWIIDLAFSPDDNLLASACGKDETIMLWKTNTWKPRRRIGTRTINGVFVSGVDFSPNGRTIAIGKNVSPTLWDVTTGKQLHDFVGDGAAVAFSPNGRLLSIGGSQTRLRIMNTASGKMLKALRGHDGPLSSAVFSHDGGLLVSGSGDGTARIWDHATGALLATIVVLSPSSGWLVITPDGLFDGTSDAMPLVTWRSSNDLSAFPLGTFFNDFYYPGLLAEIMEGGRPKATVDLATVMQLPGLRSMLSQGLARLDRRDGKSVLCFAEAPSARPRVYVDGNLLDNIPNEQFHQDDPGCNYRVDLPAGQQYEIQTATNDAATKAFNQPDGGVKSETAESTLHVLTVAVDRYDLSSSGFTPLFSSVKGAKEVQRFFTEQESNAKKPYRTIHVWEGLYDGKATRDEIRRRLSDMAKEVKEDDVVLLFFSGHGTVPAGQEMFYFAPIDMRGPSPEDQTETGLNTAMLADAIREMPAGRIVLIIDACQSGGAIESLGKIGEVKAKVEMRKAQMEKVGGNGRKHEVGIYIIAAATPLQEAVQPKTGNGALVVTLLEVLRDENKTTSGEVWMRDLVKHLQKRLPEVSAQIGQTHTPMVMSIGQDFPLAVAKSN